MMIEAFYPIGTPGQSVGSRGSRCLALAHRPCSAATKRRCWVSSTPCARASTWSEYGRLDYPPDSYPLFAIRSRAWRDELPVRAGDRRRARLRNQRRARRAAVRRPACGGLCGPHQPAGGAVRQPVGLRAHPPLEPGRARPEPLVPRRQPGAGIGGADAPGRAAARSRAGLHVDLHETTDTDESEFRPALAARDGVAYEPGEVPDGFYLVDDSETSAAGVPAGDHRGGGEGHPHRAGRREGRDHRFADGRAGRHRVRAEAPRPVRRHHRAPATRPPPRSIPTAPAPLPSNATTRRRRRCVRR